MEAYHLLSIQAHNLSMAMPSFTATKFALPCISRETAPYFGPRIHPFKILWLKMFILSMLRRA
eukprot:CAMPEP_0172746158 /NCGR_PEP_ID=MMETSP1074-20121228/139774_1 /TAXON_ID=2916 /ORGANISM="Ceratium fusus, Strain PA161109" /LENGTH=62 /DNA_ID=CAMNT_0013577457 /DNA_START=92 /DNA_END=277 /DNA_ORIENTATION=+